MLDQVFFSLDAKNFRDFRELLDAPPSANPALERLLATVSPLGKRLNLARRTARCRHPSHSHRHTTAASSIAVSRFSMTGSSSALSPIK